MPNNEATFQVEGVRWRKKMPWKLCSDDPSAEVVRVDVKKATMRCKSCGAAWEATEGIRQGQFLVGSGGMLYTTCRFCGVSGAASLPRFRYA